MTEPLAELLDRLVPADEAATGDWRAVLDAAGAAPARRRPRLTRRRVAVACVLALAATVVSVTPAFGLHDLLLDLVRNRTPVSFDRTRPAPAAIKKQFLDLGIGAPPGMNPQVLPDQARQITFRGAGGQKRVLWIAPTRGGGFCSILVGAGGGCIARSTEERAGPLVTGGSFSQTRGGPLRMVELDGHVVSPEVATLTLEFQDHTSLRLPFVYVSSPIDAGFFIAGIPSDHQQTGRWPTEVVARDRAGTVIATAPIRIPTLPKRPLGPGRFTPQPPRTLPRAASVTPASPVQTGSADGVSVVAGANGAVRLTTHAVPPALERLLHGNVTIDCFRLTREFGIFTVRGDGVNGAFADSIGLTLSGVGRPLDGCELDSSRGHRWPDPLGSHSPVEIPLTARGGAYFADRAAARDLALFVRSGRMQKIRREPGAQLVHDMIAAYGAALAKSRIRYELTPGGITFTEASSTGRRFRVAVRAGRIVAQNLEPYAKVF